MQQLTVIIAAVCCRCWCNYILCKII